MLMCRMRCIDPALQAVESASLVSALLHAAAAVPLSSHTSAHYASGRCVQADMKYKD